MEKWVSVLVKWILVFLIVFLLCMLLVTTLLSLERKSVPAKPGRPAYLYY